MSYMEQLRAMYKTSFIFLNYGSPHLLEAAISSFLTKCTSIIPAFEFIIVDNYTSDENCNAIRSIKNKYPSISIHLIFNSSNIGYGAGNNVGLRFSFENLSSNLAFVLNTDIIFEEVHRDISFEPIASEPMLYTFNVIENHQNISFNEFSRFTFRSKPSDVKTKNSYPSGCCWGMNRKMWEISKGFVESHFLYFEELEFIYRYKKGFKKFPELTKIENLTISHSQGGTTGISRDVRSRSLISEFWSARSRIKFAKNCISLSLPIAIFYNILLVAHRLAKGSPSHAKTILRATFSALFNNSLTKNPLNTIVFEPAIVDVLPQADLTYNSTTTHRHT